MNESSLLCVYTGFALRITCDGNSVCESTDDDEIIITAYNHQWRVDCIYVLIMNK